MGDYKEIFEFITSPNIDDSNFEVTLDDILKRAKQFESFNVADEVFRQTHIPRKMQDITDYEKDYEKMKKGEKELVYPKIMGMKSDMSGPDVTTSALPSTSTSTSNDNDTKEEEEDDSSESESGDDSGSGSEVDDAGNKTSRRPKNETAEEKKVSTWWMIFPR